MPYFDLTTNVKEIPSDFNKKTTDVIAESLGKPAGAVGVHINAGAALTMGGTDEAAGVLYLSSAGCLGPEENKSHSKAISDHLQKELNIPSSRLLIFFHDYERTCIGKNGTTLAK